MRKSSDWDHAYRTGDYKKYWGIPYPSQELVCFVANFPPTNQQVALDVGCGAGQEAIFLAQQGFSVIGIDQSEAAIKIATSQSAKVGVQIDWKLGNVLSLPIDDQSVDFINDRGCLHHISEDDRHRYAQELARVIKPTGKVLIRGCREVNNERFYAVTQNTIEQHFSPFFTHSPILPIELANNEKENLSANLVILTRRS